MAAPITCGTVVGVKFDGGTMIAADTYSAHGNRTFDQIRRVVKVNKMTVLGFSGCYDQYIKFKKNIDREVMLFQIGQSKKYMMPDELCHWIANQLYEARMKQNPLYIEMVVGGMSYDQSHNLVPFLGIIGPYGFHSANKQHIMVTHPGEQVVAAMVSEHIPDKNKILTRTEAMDLIKKIMEILYYRICQASNRYHVAICTKDGVEIKGPLAVAENWQCANIVQGF